MDEEERNKEMSSRVHDVGDTHFISFLGAILARLAYMKDSQFINSYTSIMGPVILPGIMTAIDSVRASNLKALIDDETLFELNDDNSRFKDFLYTYNGKKFIDFVRLLMPSNANSLNGDTDMKSSFPTTVDRQSMKGPPTEKGLVKYISIAWSNYGSIYVVADKRMPHTLFLLFRGTYSAKTASIYTKPTSLLPLTVCTDADGQKEGYLYGMFKVATEMIHTVIEAMRFLAVNFLEAKEPSSIKIFGAGHSLGAACLTIFSLLWMNVKAKYPYDSKPYDVLAQQMVCISLGSPRVLNKVLARKFCNFIRNGDILYRRVITRGDPVPSLPPGLGMYEHPCSNDPEAKQAVAELCNANLEVRRKKYPQLNDKWELSCKNKADRTYIPNQLSHTAYLNILYIFAFNLGDFGKGMISSKTKEISRTTDKHSVCRLVMGDNDGEGDDMFQFRVIFFDMEYVRADEAKSFLQKLTTIGGDVREDVKISLASFDGLVSQMDLLPKDAAKDPQAGKMAPKETFQIDPLMPTLACGAGSQNNETKKANKPKSMFSWGSSKKGGRKSRRKKRRTRRKTQRRS